MPRRVPCPSAHRAPGYAKSVDTRARILAATLAEASDAGLHSASLAGIAARAGVAIGNLHYHFGSREGLLHELMGSLVADLMSRLHAVDAERRSDFFERQRASMLVYLEYLRANPGVRPAGGRDQAPRAEPVPARGGRLGGAHGGADSRRHRAEDLRPMDDAEIAAQAHFLLGARHFLEQMIERPMVPHEEAVVDAYIALLRDGLGRGSSRRERSADRTLAPARTAARAAPRRAETREAMT